VLIQLQGISNYVLERSNLKTALQVGQCDKTCRLHVCWYKSRAGDGSLHSVFPCAPWWEVSGAHGRQALQHQNTHLPLPKQEHDRQCLPWDIMKLYITNLHGAVISIMSVSGTVSQMYIVF